MHIRFTVNWEIKVNDLQWVMERIGNPKLIYHDYYFCGEVTSKYLNDLYVLQDRGTIKNLGFLVISGEPTPDEVDELN